MISPKQIRECILSVANEFRKETANFRSEGNFQCLLFGQLRNLTKKYTVSGIELIHAELPTKTNIKHVGYYDLAILTRSSASLFKEYYYYGRPVQEWREVLKMFATFEIKFFNDHPKHGDKEIRKDIRRLKEIQWKNIAIHSYFLLFIDKGVDWEENGYRNLYQRFERDTKPKRYSGLEVYCIPGKGGDILHIKHGVAKSIYQEK